MESGFTFLLLAIGFALFMTWGIGGHPAAADYMDKRTGSGFGIRKVPTTSPPPHLPDDPPTFT